MRLTATITMPTYKRPPRWLKIKTMRTERADDKHAHVTVNARLAWYWRIALYTRALRSLRVGLSR